MSWMPGDPITTRELIRRARAELVDSESPLLDVECLLGYVLKCSRAELVLRAHHVPLSKEVAVFHELLQRRQLGEPIAYLIGKKYFWDFEVEVTPDTLIPRPETETLVSLAIDHLQKNPQASVLELGTGSGIIAIALARAIPNLDIVAIDRSWSAIQIARRNAQRLGQPHIQWICAEWFGSLDHRFDMIIANPPYIAADDQHLAALRFEPQLALISGENGLDDLQHLIVNAPWYLNKPGWLLLEHGAAQGESVRQSMLNKRYIDVSTHKDLAGNDRVTVGVML